MGFEIDDATMQRTVAVAGQRLVGNGPGATGRGTDARGRGMRA